MKIFGRRQNVPVIFPARLLAESYDLFLPLLAHSWPSNWDVAQHEIANLRTISSCVKKRKYKASSLRTSSARYVKMRKCRESVKTA